MNRTKPSRYVLTFLSALTLGSGSLWAQTAPTPAPGTASAQKESDSDQPVVLSPFVVEASEDEGRYQATSTLAGTRVRTDLRDVASAISVVTSQFLKDTGSKNSQDLLVYTTNTEVGGVAGNYSGLGNTNGISERGALLAPSTNTRVRGLDSADNTRDYFITDIPWDSFNVGRVDLQRGPNSILFGVGSPAGIVNSSVNTAGFKTKGSIENRIDQFGSMRWSLDYNQVLIKDELAFRVSALDDDAKYRQKPAFNNDKRLFGALNFTPKLVANGTTSIRANYEYGDVDANRPRTLSPIDKVSPYFYSSAASTAGGLPVINKGAFDPYSAWSTIVPSNSVSPASMWNPWVDFYMARLGSADPVFWYGNTSGAPFRVQQSNPSLQFGLNSSGGRDNQIDGFPFARPIGIAGYNQYTISANKINPALFPGASKNFYKDKSLTDPSIFDFYNLLIDGPNKSEWQKWNAYNVALSQTFFNNRLGFEFVYDHQDFKYGQWGNLLGDSPYIGIELNNYLVDYPSAYGTPPAVPNVTDGKSNVGRAYVGGSSHYGNSENRRTRDNYRGTVTGELRFDDFMNKSWLTDFLGRHVFTGLLSQDNKVQENRNYVLYASDVDWAQSQDLSTSISDGARQVDWITYLSGDLRNQSSAANAHIGNITVRQSPQGLSSVRYYDSHWKYPTNPSDPAYVNPGATWTNPNTGAISTQSENPLNYIGWQNRQVNILNANEGDINQLYTDASKLKETIDSKALTWQGYFWDGVIVPTYGWRHDKVTTRSANAPTDPITKVASMNYDIDGPTDSGSGDSRSWGVVLHTPKKLREKLPWGSDISVFYYDGSNFRAENRVDFEGDALPYARGKTKDYGFVVSTLHDKLTLKVNWYETKVENANLGGDPATNTLGANTYYLYLLESWGTASAMTDYEGLRGNVPGWEWYWNWAMVDNNGWGDPAWTDPNSPNVINAASTAKEKAAIDDWFKTMPKQSFFDAYGMPVNVAKAQSANPADKEAAITGWNPYNGVGGIQAAGAGKIRGLSPVGTIDNESKGYEIELTAQPTKNWNLTFNISKTQASRTELNSKLAAFIERTHARLAGPAGDLRLWWGGDATLRQYYNDNIYSAYQFQLESNGANAPELRPYRFNFVSNYNFDKGFMKGANVGVAYRWQDAQILGYGITTTTVAGVTDTKMDVNKPLYGDTEDSIDLWIGYQHRLTKKIDWRIQLNVRNVGESPHLVPISVEPDGTPAAQRIEEGSVWSLTNTFSF